MPSNFGRYLSTRSITLTVREKTRHCGKRTSVRVVPVVSNKRKFTGAVAELGNNRLVCLSTANPINGGMGTRFNVFTRGNRVATIVRVTTITNLGRIPLRRHGPLLAAACKMKRLVLTTLSFKTSHVLVNYNSSNASSKKTKVTRTLNIQFLSNGKGMTRVGKNTSLLEVGRVSSSSVSGQIERVRVSITYG